MRILHTADWHIGRLLYGQKRYEEFDAFLSWLIDIIRQEQIDVLLVAGDIFDTNVPTNFSQELYYRFFFRIAGTSCRHVVITAGNHDSPSFLNAPKELLRVLNIHVVGDAQENLDDEVLVLSNREGDPELIVCAVPYLRDRDIRMGEAGESIEDKERKLIEGLQTHYSAVALLAEKKRNELKVQVPIIAMGHLFTAGAQTVEGDGVRELYIGSLARVSATIFPKCIDYLALGHLHVPQMVNGSEFMRYSGSPLPMGFGEADQEKSVCILEFSSSKANVKLLKVPVFQKLERIRGNLENILTRILELSSLQSKAWLEIVYEDKEVIGDLRERLETAVSSTAMKILCIKNNRIIGRVLSPIHDNESLDELNVHDVFERCLAVHNVSEDQRAELMSAYRETVTALHEEDAQSE